MKYLQSFFLILSLGIVFFMTSCEENTPPTCSILSPSENTVFFHGDTIHLVVNAEDSDGIINIVRAYINNTLVDSTDQVPYELTIVAAEFDPGYHNLKATVMDDDLAESSQEIPVTIEGQYLSGTYHAEYDTLDSHGWKTSLDFTLSFDAMSEVDFDSYYMDGQRKSEDSIYNARMLSITGINPEIFTPMIESAIQNAVITPEFIEFDVVTGATHSSGEAIELTKALLTAARNRDTSPVFLPYTDDK